MLTFTFDLNMLVERRCQVAQVNETADASDVRMILGYVSVTASETRFDVSFVGTKKDAIINEFSTWSAHGSLRPGASANAIDVWSDCAISDCAFSYVGSSLLEKNTDQWTLTIDDLISSEVMAISHPEVKDSWTFHFTMPPASICTSVPAPVGTKTP
jgi:hypothetical protein